MSQSKLTTLPSETTSNHESPDLSLDHLHAEMNRIDVMIRREVRRFQLAGQDPADTFRGLFISDAKANALVAKPFATGWGQLATLDSAEAQTFAHALAQSEQEIASVFVQARQAGQTLRLAHLAHVFQLDRFALDTLLICLASALDLRYERLYGYLQDDVTRKHPSVSLVLDLLCEGGPERLHMLAHFADDAPLFRYRLLEKISEPPAANVPLLSQTLLPDEAVVAWLLGHYHPNPTLSKHISLHAPQPEEIHELLAGDALPTLQRTLTDHTLIAFYGPDQARQEAGARYFAAQRRQLLLRVDLSTTNDDVPALPIVELALRDAQLLDAIPFFIGWDTVLSEGRPHLAILGELSGYPDTAIVSGQNAWQVRGVERERNWHWLEFSMPDYAQRHALWSRFLREAADSPMDVTLLAGQFNLTATQIRDAVTAARDMAMQRGAPLEMEDLFEAARSHSSPSLSGQARKIKPRYTWSDIVLPEDQILILHEIIATVRGRPIVLGEWGIGKKLTASHGVTILFAGPPGTGKTMAAEVIASELGLELYKIELSSLVSKYIGETEKNLERIFKEAETSNAILFFDEADAIFGKRSEVKDAHDRYANIEISYLLQRMEAYDGVTILATNLRANLDEAFTRRLQFAVDFPFPDEAYRLRIWQTLFPPNVPRAADIDFALLARRFRLAGGNIRNIIVSAAFLAASDGGVVKMEHLLHGTRRELQKMGRLLKEGDLQVG